MVAKNKNNLKWKKQKTIVLTRFKSLRKIDSLTGLWSNNTIMLRNKNAKKLKIALTS